MQLKFLLDVGNMAKTMKQSGKVRVRQFTHDTSNFVFHICNAFVDLAKYLLETSNSYVIFGWFTTNPLEKYFGKLRQGSGGAYFITAQSVIEKVKIHHSKLSLKLNVEVNFESGHNCDMCVRDLNDQEIEIIDNLPELELKVQDETMFSFVYISGYIQLKNGYDNNEESYLYYDRFGNYFDSLNRGGLTPPYDNVVQWAVFCFILFN